MSECLSFNQTPDFVLNTPSELKICDLHPYARQRGSTPFRRLGLLLIILEEDEDIITVVISLEPLKFQVYHWMHPDGEVIKLISGGMELISEH